MREQRPELRLAVAGAEGWQAPLLQDDWIDALGFVDDEQLRRLYRGASVFVYPSHLRGLRDSGGRGDGLGDAGRRLRSSVPGRRERRRGSAGGSQEPRGVRARRSSARSKIADGSSHARAEPRRPVHASGRWVRPSCAATKRRSDTDGRDRDRQPRRPRTAAPLSGQPRRNRLAEGALEIVVVDNASSDGSVEAVRERHPEVRVVEADRNLGFAAGANRALDELRDVEFVALLNNDTVVEPGLAAPARRGTRGRSGPRRRGVRRSSSTDSSRSCGWTRGRSRSRADPRPVGVRRERRPGRRAGRVAASAVRQRLASGGARRRRRLPVVERPGTAARAGRSKRRAPHWLGARVAGGTRSTASQSTSINNAGSILVEGGYGADRGLPGGRRGPVQRAGGGLRVVRRRRPAPAAHISTTSAASTSACSSTTRTSTSPGAGRRGAGATATSLRSVVRHVHTRFERRGLGASSTTTSSATGCSSTRRTRRPAMRLRWRSARFGCCS